MTWERAGRLVWIAPVLAVAFSAAFLTLLAPGDAEGVEVLFLLTFLAYATVGALIVSRHPRHTVGWLFCVVGVASAATELLYTYGGRTGEPGATAAAWVSAWSAEPSSVAIVLLLLLFPTGRYSSPSSRLVGRAALGTALVWALALALDPGPLRSTEATANPLGIEAAGSVLDVIADLSVIPFLCCLAAAVIGVVVRLRRLRGEERQQLKWLVLAAGVMLAALVIELGLLVAVDTDRGAWDFVSALVICTGLAAFPVAAGMAILRHRLYDIDVVINRALVYGALTASLGGTYLAVVLPAGLAVGESDLAIAASTLAVAALFRPVRARIQAAVDRRFYRRRYDAALTLQAFGARLRDELDLEALGDDLRGAARETVQPAHVSLWLRGELR